MNSREIRADLASLKRAAELLERGDSEDVAHGKRLRRMIREIEENVLLIGHTKRSAPITEFERKLIDQR